MVSWTRGNRHGLFILDLPLSWASEEEVGREGIFSAQRGTMALRGRLPPSDPCPRVSGNHPAGKALALPLQVPRGGWRRGGERGRGIRGGSTPAHSSRAPGLSQGLGEKMPIQIVDLGPRCCSVHNDVIDCQTLRHNPFDPNNNNVTKDTVVVTPVFHMGKLRLGGAAKVTN